MIWDLWRNLLYMLGRRAERPAFLRFGYIEKAEYWALMWGTAVMTVTGVVLWFENESLRMLSKRMLDLAPWSITTRPEPAADGSREPGTEGQPPAPPGAPE